MEENLKKSEKTILGKKYFIAVGSFIISVALHLFVLAPAFLSDVANVDMKLKWMESFNDLEGLSTETGRWATLENVPEKKIEEPEQDEPKPDVEPEVEPEPEIKKKPVNTTVKATKQTKKKKKKTPIETKKNTKVDRNVRVDYDRSGPSGLPDISGYGPGNAVYSAMVRTDRIRGTVFQKAMTELIQRIPDYRIILQNTTIDPIRHVDMLYLASARPASISATFLAMKHRMTNGMIQKKLDRRFKDVPPWREYRKKPIRDLLPINDVYQDDRKIFLAKNGLAILGKEKWIKKLYRKDERSESSMMSTLNRIQEATEDEQSLILVTARKIQMPIPGLGKQVFQTVKLEISNITMPKVLIELSFEDVQKAMGFSGQCGRMKKSILTKMGPLRFVYGSLVQRLTCSTTEKYVVVEGIYKQKEILSLLNLISQFIPRPKILDALPEQGISDLRNPVNKNEIDGDRTQIDKIDSALLDTTNLQNEQQKERENDDGKEKKNVFPDAKTKDFPLPKTPNKPDEKGGKK